MVDLPPAGHAAGLRVAQQRVDLRAALDGDGVDPALAEPAGDMFSASRSPPPMVASRITPSESTTQRHVGRGRNEKAGRLAIEEAGHLLQGRGRALRAWARLRSHGHRYAIGKPRSNPFSRPPPACLAKLRPRPAPADRRGRRHRHPAGRPSGSNLSEVGTAHDHAEVGIARGPAQGRHGRGESRQDGLAGQGQADDVEPTLAQEAGRIDALPRAQPWSRPTPPRGRSSRRSTRRTCGSRPDRASAGRCALPAAPTRSSSCVQRRRLIACSRPSASVTARKSHASSSQSSPRWRAAGASRSMSSFGSERPPSRSAAACASMSTGPRVRSIALNAVISSGPGTRFAAGWRTGRRWASISRGRISASTIRASTSGASSTGGR